MTRATITSWGLAVVLGVVALAAGFWLFGPDDPTVAFTRFLHETFDHDADPKGSTPPAGSSSNDGAAEGLLYGRVTTVDGAVHEGRLRWGDNEEAVWGNYFNGRKEDNPWAAYVPEELLPKERNSLGAFGLEFIGWDSTLDLGRPFMVRFGDIARIDPRGREIRITLKSGAVYSLDRFAADDLADNVRVWNEDGGSVVIDEWQIRSIELLPSPATGAGPSPLHGTVHTPHGEFTGMIQWEREECLVTDELHGRTADGVVSLRFETIRSIARDSTDSTLVTLRDGREIVLTGTRGAGRGNRGTYVDDPRYGRVLVSWDAFERVEFTPGDAGPGYDDFAPGRPIRGTVITRSGSRFSGALVYDLDESETTETLDAPFQGVDYTIPFDLVASILLPASEDPARRAEITLRSGEKLQLELAGDLGEWNLGMLVFVDDDERPAYLPWADVQRIEIEPPPEARLPNVPHAPETR